jgi:DNA-binding MarR family transcriptional regulator
VGTTGWHFFLDLWTAGHKGERLAARELDRAGVDGEHLIVLLRLSAEQRPVTQTELSAAVGVPFSTMTHALGRLATRGEIERVPHPTDGRALLIRLTPLGKRRVARAKPALERALKQLGRDHVEAIALLAQAIDDITTSL